MKDWLTDVAEVAILTGILWFLIGLFLVQAGVL